MRAARLHSLTTSHFRRRPKCRLSAMNSTAALQLSQFTERVRRSHPLWMEEEKRDRVETAEVCKCQISDSFPRRLTSSLCNYTYISTLLNVPRSWEFPSRKKARLETTLDYLKASEAGKRKKMCAQGEGGRVELMAFKVVRCVPRPPSLPSG